MTKGNGLRVTLAGLGALVVFGLIVSIVPLRSPEMEASGAEPDSAPVPSEAASLQAAEPIAPSFDTVRVEADGRGLVAGLAEPGASVTILAGDAVAGETVADADGRFVAFLALPPSTEPQALSLTAGAAATPSEETVIVAPIGAPAGVATAELVGERAGEPPAAVFARAPALSDDASDGEALAGAGVPDQALETPVLTISGLPVSATQPSPAEPPAAALDPVPAAASNPAAAPAPSVAVDASTPPAADAPATPPILVADADGVRVLQPPLSPGAETEDLAVVALDAIAYDGAGEVVLSGRSAEGGSVRLYVDNELAAEAETEADGRWEADLTGTPPGIYTLRVDEVDAKGAVLSRIETPFQREERQAVADAMAAVENGAPPAPGMGAATGRNAVAMRTVQPGNTLWAIARERYGEPMMYVRVFEMNRDRIRNADLIYPGQVFVLPATFGR